ncbi:LPS export ABC transporter ATP-binding protein [Piscirickettsia salmonis]|uniref:LPS export ABC transporter ATP-binding protein n=1 Tax=Piscirickettsia salmonis TaxID=1238 RepID=UPI0007C88CD3|nr:Lipopolysaccharide export system ATP-binding protein LptB [Piscirickettsiaceae bacterium NZ-RLO1]
MTVATLKAHQIAKRYKGRWVAEDISLHVNQGEIVGLLGPNGAGKTTSFYMMVGLVACDQGEIYIDHTEITDWPIHKRSQLGISYLPQEASIFRHLTTSQNILAILELQPKLSKQQRQAKLAHLLDELNIEHIKDNIGISLSGGERRRVEIARALATNPKFILLDEPFAGVDPISITDIKESIFHLKERNIGVLITDHNVRETLDICERAYIVNAGHIIAADTPENILTDPNVRRYYLGDEFRL